MGSDAERKQSSRSADKFIIGLIVAGLLIGCGAATLGYLYGLEHSIAEVKADDVERALASMGVDSKTAMKSAADMANKQMSENQMLRFNARKNRKMSNWLYYAARQSAGDGTTQDAQLAQLVSLKKKPTIAILSSYDDPLYDIMSELTTDTKVKYAGFYGYAFFLDQGPNLLRLRNQDPYKVAPELMPETQKQGQLMIESFRKHWNDGFEWLMWTSVDVLLTNPYQKITDLIAAAGEGHTVVLSRDGKRLVNPAIVLVKVCKESQRLLDRWETEMKNLDSWGDPGAAYRDGMESSAATELSVVSYLPQDALTPFPDVELRYEPVNRSSSEWSQLQARWSDQSYFVHISNCFQSCPNSMDPFCCYGMAGKYHTIFMANMYALIRDPDKPKGTGASEDKGRQVENIPARFYLCM
mmetsp:Transcript_22304/g.38521  ORF Transcript_22304/g.38521 Transcript_22304/m.38521 type:complete len:412 (-) Transcript_22304:55-1290(-)|eukprot:CAMPEP_0184698804 /NCGR_PEP_ID=MMETSP0313-20130426/5289_1 /TAXON_ID=2792 /ORGANISM="Porphyridium aerugineum, Strain SAG 1380-2" /LENGTH=411 /DNA_ID=CAMNT_0027157791 /DNA_START=131 /DNA_END=1366 /DNA_ORIENTATION=-